MKPITLSVKGLHSFREKQTVDFEALCEGGVFGIFGPTGSGKSSLLDAMTLALYGKVERAANNTQGILNHGEETLAVSFTFQLGNGNRKKRFLVERTFKQSGEGNLRTATARLIDITGEPIVLADKAGDVTKGVEDLLGLSIDDFTRAVVLPQGKFSEFLSLKGKDRRQMLQRIFHLEKYGDELMKKLKSRLVDTKHQKELVEKEQEGLGNASKEALGEAKKKLEDIKKQQEVEKKKYEVLEKRFDEEKLVLKLQREKGAAENRLKELSLREGELKELERTLLKGKEAAILLPYVEELEESFMDSQRWALEGNQLKEKLDDISEEAKKGESLFLEVKSQREEQESRLRIKLEEYERMKREQEVLNQEEQIVMNLEKQLKEQEKLLKENEEKLDQAKQDKKQYEEAQRKLKAELKSIEIPGEKKRELTAARDQKQQIDQSMNKITELDSEEKSLEKKINEVKENGNRILEETSKIEGDLSTRFQQIYGWYQEVCEAERYHQELIRSLKEIKRAEEGKQQHLLAHALRKQLKEGEPCPVCGSFEHPQTKIELEAGENTVVELDWMDKLIEEISSEERKLERYRWKLDEYSSKLEDFVKEDQIAAALEEEKDPFLSNVGGDQEKWAACWSRTKGKWNKKKLAIDELLETTDNRLKEMQQTKEKWNQFSIQISGLEERLTETRNRKQERTEGLEGQKLEWDNTYPSLAFSRVEKEYQTLLKQEEKATVIRQRIENSVPHIERKLEEVDKLQKLLQDVHLKKTGLMSETDHRKNGMKEKKRLIENSVGESNPQALLEKTSLALQELVNRYEKAEYTWKKLQHEMNEIVKRDTIIKEAIKNSQERYNRASKVFDKQVKGSSFTDKGEIKVASLTNAEQERLTVSINEFNQEKKEQEVKLAQSLKELSGRSVTEEQFDQTLLELQQSKNYLEERSSERGAALATLRELELRVNRYEELNQQWNKLEKELDRLQKLDHVFRGKAFVEYIAEEQLVQVSRLASDRLHSLTRGRYAIEVDSTGGFVIRDDANGGVKRPVSTLSGGETFLTSLALALSLSASIQLKGEHPLEFFFLDEGFGTLDQDLLEIVITALEKLHTDHLSVGIISHVPELRERLPRKLIVTPAEAGGKGSSVRLESM
ncbi:AAA family ATPase [Evansella tamaricis]|uniref:AAA family ATPase n=1 Tax=Evansella tamaricis TaxID=2069301 RepID=A0ABS6JEA1_9BACI|nr:AAA family ATPase [Evansella tamaricis]MBU9711504.1 AAA family ATPase [Evansella tamaricis]